jgi:hypothetical protein
LATKSVLSAKSVPVAVRLTGWLTELAIADGDFERAARLLNAGLGQLRPLGDPWGIARCLSSIKRRLRRR